MSLMPADGSVFGTHAATYGAARHGYPCEVFTYLSTQTNTRARLLDMGCGTGIASRQCAEQGYSVTASDSDVRMVRQAQQDSVGYAIRYLVAPAHAHPSARGAFEILIAFGAFHWFDDDASVREIVRLLAPRGLCFVVNKQETGDLKTLIKRTLAPYVAAHLRMTDMKAHYDPTLTLQRHGFLYVHTHTLPTVERYTIESAVQYVQSTHAWSLVPPEHRAHACIALHAMFTNKAQYGLVERPLDVRIVCGERPCT